MTVIVCLVILTVLGGSLLALARARRRQVRQDERRLQAAWLAEAGVERAAARLARSADYEGETWAVPGADLGGPRGAAVTIAVGPVAGRPGRRAVDVRADYPAGEDDRARRSLRVFIDMSELKARNSRGDR
jgi:hypothetical protein